MPDPSQPTPPKKFEDSNRFIKTFIKNPYKNKIKDRKIPFPKGTFTGEIPYSPPRHEIGARPIHRMVFISLVIDGLDDEEWWTFADDVPYHREDSASATIHQFELPSVVMSRSYRWGGEIRVEVTLQAQVTDSDGRVTMRVNTKFFEGASEDTSDLEEENEQNFFCTPVNDVLPDYPSGGCDIFVGNTEVTGTAATAGHRFDYASIRILVWNIPTFPFFRH